MQPTPPFASNRDLKASGLDLLVALPIPGMVRLLQLSACLEFKTPYEFRSKVDEQALARRNHKGQRSQAAFWRRRCRFYGFHKVCHSDARKHPEPMSRWRTMRTLGLRTESRAQLWQSPPRRPRAIENRRFVPLPLHVSLF